MADRKMIYLDDAIEAVVKESQMEGAYGYMDTKSIVDFLRDLPSAQPERKTDENNHYKTGYDQGFVDACKMYEKKQPENNCSEIPNNSDLISRQDAIDAICAVCGNDCDKSEFVYNAPQDEQVILCPEHYCLCTLPSAQPELPFEIQDIIDYLDTVLHPIISPDHWSVYAELYDMISALPSAKPERKTGRWIYGEDDVAMCDGYHCSECGFFVPWDYKRKFIDFIKDYNFCPNCGSPMEKEGEG